jgi:predicted PurR-regulated permease PerM
MRVMSASRPEVLPRGLLLLLGAAAAVIVLAGARAVADILGPVFLALVLTVLVHPVRVMLTKRHAPAWLATILCIIGVYLILITLAVAMVLAAARFVALLPTYQNDLQSLLDSLASTLDKVGVTQRQIDDFTGSLDLSRLSDLVLGIAGGLVSITSNLVLIFTIVLFMALDASTFPAKLAAATDHTGLATSFHDFAAGTRTYLLVSTVFGLIVAVIDSATLALLGVPLPLVWGLLAFITNYVPNIGFIIGLVPPAVLALLEGGPGLMLAVIVAYCVINFVLQSVIQPKFVGDAVGLSVSITFLSLVFWAFVLGPLGALLAVPLTLLVKAVLIDADPRNAWLVPLLSSKPAES